MTHRELTVPEQHQLKIARDTLKMPDAMVAVMGGPSKAEAAEIIERLTGNAVLRLPHMPMVEGGPPIEGIDA